MFAEDPKAGKDAQWCAAAFAVNTFVVQTSQLGWYGETNSEMSKRYQTFVTPAGWAFSIWGYIYLSQAAFTIYILLPSCSEYARRVVSSITYPWIAAQFFQVAWTFIFAQDMVLLSLAAMLGIYASLFVVTLRLHSLRSSSPHPLPMSSKDFHLCHVPFQVHFGWITCASLVNTSVVIRSLDYTLPSQLSAASVTLTLAILSSMTSIAYRGDFVHALVVAWALLALSRQLSLTTNPLPFSAAGSPYVEGLAGASLFLSHLSTAASLATFVAQALPAGAMITRWRQVAWGVIAGVEGGGGGGGGGEGGGEGHVIRGGAEGMGGVLLDDDGAKQLGSKEVKAEGGGGGGGGGTAGARV